MARAARYMDSDSGKKLEKTGSGGETLEALKVPGSSPPRARIPTSTHGSRLPAVGATPE